MARAKTQSNGHLEETLAALNQNQATFLARASETDRQLLQLDRRYLELKQSSDECFARIEAILIDLSRVLQAMPEAIRDKFGFKMLEAPRPAG